MVSIISLSKTTIYSDQTERIITKTISYRVPQGSVLRYLLFILYINDMHNSIKNCKIRHFADDTNLLLTNSSLKKINRQVNDDLFVISHWLRTSKISLIPAKQKS